jgi:multicomponent Na+:H+ antiporter subunit F
MIAGIATAVAFVLVLCILMAVYRVVAGPSLPDRVIALDVIGTNIVGLILVLEIKSNSRALVDAALVIALLAFMGTVALAKYLAGGTVIDRGDH